MVRDYSKFFSTAPASPVHKDTLTELGWGPFFARQISTEDLISTPPVRVTAVHRSGLTAVGEEGEVTLPPRADATVGDWLLFDHSDPKASAVLERKSIVKRRAAGHDRREQLIAANIDTSFIVTSCNRDFNIARLERYLALAMEAEITPVILLTKIDLCDDPQSYIEQARSISSQVEVVALDARNEEPTKLLAPWCASGQTVAFLGSSGVGKSTLTNALSEGATVETQAIREADARGRHTTTHRELHFIKGGCAVLDTPGMRELQITDAASGIEALFSEIEDLTALCKFRDCAHETEPGCAVLAAIEGGKIDAGQVQRWKKLKAEDAFNSSSLAERRSKDKAFGKMIKTVLKDSKK